jgi:hypothetical protein
VSVLADAFGSDRHRRAARRALAAARPGVDLASCHPLGRGNRKETALVTLVGGDSVVVQSSDDERGLDAERVVVETLGERTSVPVPAVLGAGRADGVAALVTDYVAGRDLHEAFVAFDAANQRALARSFGRSLADVHGAFRFERYGPVRVDEPGGGSGASLVGTADEWDAWLSSYGRAGLDRLPPAFDDLRADLAALFADPPVDPSPPARLFPWDFRPGNALVADGSVAAVLDWEAPLAAPPALSVAKARYLVADWYVDDPDPLRTAFAEGYEAVRPLPAVRPVHRAAAVCQTAVDSTGAVTDPGYPEFDRERSVAFHRRALERILADAG